MPTAALARPLSSPRVASIVSRNPDPKCRLCRCVLATKRGDDFQTLLCAECKDRPEAKRLGPVTRDSAGALVARPFTAADRSMIKQAGAFLPAGQLLGVLNERLFADLGPDVPPYSMAQFQEALREQSIGGPFEPAGDWSSLRRLLGKARREGVLDRITPQVINDFAVVFSLSTAQALHLKDVLIGADGDVA